jgi:hypothetical protein
MELSNELLGKEILTLMERILNYCEVVVPPQQYKSLRSKVLSLGNDCIRNLTDINRGTPQENLFRKTEMGEMLYNKIKAARLLIIEAENDYLGTLRTWSKDK